MDWSPAAHQVSIPLRKFPRHQKTARLPNVVHVSIPLRKFPRTDEGISVSGPVDVSIPLRKFPRDAPLIKVFGEVCFHSTKEVSKAGHGKDGARKSSSFHSTKEVSKAQAYEAEAKMAE